MEYRPLGKSGLRVSALGLGGHEYHPDGKLKGFSDNFDAAIQPGYVNPDFASPQRRQLVGRALETGINYFDATIDPEVRALGQCLPREKTDLLIQCRPQAMCYHYDPGNRGLADLNRLRSEVERLIALTGRGKIDILNFGIETPALQDESYFDKISRNIASLKKEKLIRFAACDSLKSGEEQYLRVMRSGCFDIVWLNFGPLCPFATERIFPLARELGMGVAVREAFQKGNLFRVAQSDPSIVAGAALRWILSHAEISTLIIGVRSAEELDLNRAATALPFSRDDLGLLERLRAVPAFAAALSEQERLFYAKN